MATYLPTACLSPSVALSSYFLEGVVPQWNPKHICKGLLPMMVTQLCGLLSIMFFPDVALWLPRQMYGE